MRAAALTALLVLFAEAVAAQDRVDPVHCSAHFAARAEWLRVMGGNPDTAEMMARHSAKVLAPPPGDWGMDTGFGRPRSAPTEPPPELVLDSLTAFAEAGEDRHLPLCMEDEFCRACTRLMQSLVEPE